MTSENQVFTVLLFAGVRQRAGRDRVTLQLRPGTTVRELLVALANEIPEIADGLGASRVAVDHSFAAADDPIPPGAEIAVIPPVSGGHDGPIDATLNRVRLTGLSLQLQPVVDAVTHANAGGVTTFTGNVRELSRGKVIRHLEYEAYPPMALKVMDAIAAAIESEISGTRVAIHHRVGHLEIGEPAVIIAASAPHRAEAFDACRAAIERLKRDVPIWKKEVAVTGEAWIGQGP